MQRVYKNLPLYEAKITKDYEGLTALSLVENPAVESNFVCFKADSKPVMFSIQNEEEHIISGVVMLCNTPIYRKNGDFEYYIMYKPDTIKTMATKMLEDGTFKNINLQHEGELIDGVSLVELFIKDENKGINPTYVDNIPNGSLMASYHVENPDLWDEIKNNNLLNGFSLEGYFNVEPIEMNKQIKSNTSMKTNKIAKFVKNLIKYGSAETDKGNLYWEGDGEIEVGLEVYVENEEGIKEAASDGDYEYGDKIIVVKDGKIDAINDKESEDTAVEDEISVAASKFARIKQAYEESYEEKERQIIEAIRAKGYADSWLIEAGESYAVIEAWNEDKGDYDAIRFEISWDEDGNVIVGESEEVKPAFVPVDTDVEKVAEDEEKEEFEDESAAEEEAIEENETNYEDRIKALEDAIKALEDRVAAIESSPASETVEEEFEAVSRKQNFKGNKAAKLLSHLNG